MTNETIVTLVAAAVIALAIIYVGYVIVKYKKKGLAELALYLVSAAEKEWGSKTGQIKYAQVVSEIKKRYPVVTLFINDDILKEIIESALQQMKNILQNSLETEEDT